MYTIKNIKRFKGHEGEPCAQGTLHSTTGKVADWSDDSWGGPMQIHFTTPAEEAAFADFAKKYLVDKLDFEGKPLDIPRMTPYQLVETALEELSMKALEDAELLKAAKSGIAYFRRDPVSPDGKALYIVKAPYTADNVTKLREKVPDLLEIVNERLGLPFADPDMHRIAEENKRYKRLCKTSILYTLKKADGSMQVMQMKVPYSSATAANLRSRQPALVEIINERYL